ncbi:MAG: type 4a pilus biogenesis protein PilO [Bradymonadaceae bacterium]
MDDLIDQFNSYPLGLRWAAFATVFVFLFVVFWFFFYSPVQARIEQQKEERKNLVEKHQKYKQLSENRAQVRRKINKLEKAIMLAKEKLPGSAQIPRLLQLIHEKAKTAGLKILNFERKPDEQKEYYVEIPIAMKLQGSYSELTDFFEYVERMSRIVNFRNLKLKRTPMAGGAGTLTVTTTAVTYRYREKK